MPVLVTGDSGYIGAHICRLLVERGDTPLVVDDFVSGLRHRIAGMPHLELELDLAAPGAATVLAELMRDEAVDAVIHLAARKQVGESVTRPLWYHQQNRGPSPRCWRRCSKRECATSFFQARPRSMATLPGWSLKTRRQCP